MNNESRIDGLERNLKSLKKKRNEFVERIETIDRIIVEFEQKIQNEKAMQIGSGMKQIGE